MDSSTSLAFAIASKIGKEKKKKEDEKNGSTANKNSWIVPKGAKANQSASFSSDWQNFITVLHENMGEDSEQAIFSNEEIDAWARQFLTLYRVASFQQDKDPLVQQFVSECNKFFRELGITIERIPLVSLRKISNASGIEELFEQSMRMLPLISPRTFLAGVALAISGLFPVELLEESVFAVIDSLSEAGTARKPNRKTVDMYLALSKTLGRKRVDAIVVSLPKHDSTRCAYNALRNFLLATRKQYEAFVDHVDTYVADNNDGSCGCEGGGCEEEESAAGCRSCTSRVIEYGRRGGISEPSEESEVAEQSEEPSATESSEAEGWWSGYQRQRWG